MKRKRIATILLVVCVVSISCFAVDGNEVMTYTDGYNETLMDVGLTHERYANMPEETRAIYANMHIENVETVTKYYRIVETAASSIAYSLINGPTEMIVEISEEEYNEETSSFLNSAQATVSMLDADEDSVSTSWLRMTTRLALGQTDRWTLSTDVAYVSRGDSNGSTDIITLGTNAQCSIVADSDYIHRNYSMSFVDTGIYIEDVDAYPDVQTKSAVGYASYYPVEYYEMENTVYFIVVVKPNTSVTTTIDGYGGYRRRNTILEPSISFGVDGASVSVSPSSSWTVAPNTHVQLDR